ncbi:hypothetical protein M8818_003377 [Zalaria obscura]|uniref:Uncharacterized protein n=1 Tax=Zalaria obscura TaxID=2024903 RepID=A0ACC3SFK5_9PEZI
MAAVPMSSAKRLRQLLSDPSRMVVAPGVYDGISARLALAQGFECLYMTGAGTNMSRLGMADLGIATFNDMVTNAGMIASINPSVPLIADADTGYGGPIMVARTVQGYARAGVAGLHIEDQVQEKRCGHLAGKQLVEREVFYARIRAAKKAREEIGSEMLIIARTDARAGAGFEEAVERLRGAREAGADALFLEAMQSEEEVRKAVKIFEGTPMLLNMVGGGKTPQMSVKEAKEAGFRIMIWPTLLVEAVISPLKNALRILREEGTHDSCEPIGPRALFEVCGLNELMAFDESVGGKAFGGQEFVLTLARIDPTLRVTTKPILDKARTVEVRRGDLYTAEERERYGGLPNAGAEVASIRLEKKGRYKVLVERDGTE